MSGCLYFCLNESVRLNTSEESKFGSVNSYSATGHNFLSLGHYIEGGGGN